MPAPVLQFKRGPSANIGVASFKAGEPGFTTDKYDFYIGLDGTSANQKFLGSSRYWNKESATTGSEVRILEGADNGSHYVALKSPDSLDGSVTYTLPTSDATTSGQVLTSNSSGTLSWSNSLGDTTFTGISTFTDFLEYEHQFGSIGAGTTLTYTVTVGAQNANDRYNGTGSGSKYRINGKETPFITLVPGRKYKFDQSDNSNSSHPLLFYKEANKTTLYSTGVTTAGTPGSSGAYTEIEVTDSTPQILYYQCSAHAHMGNAIFAPGKSSGTLNISDGSSTGSVDLSSQSLILSGTSSEVEVSVTNQTATIGLPDTVEITTLEATNLKAKDGVDAITITNVTGDVGISSNLTVTGNLSVLGSQSVVNTETLKVEDSLIEVGLVNDSGNLVAPTSDLNYDIGLLMHYFNGSAKKAAVLAYNSGTSQRELQNIIIDCGSF
jgi:hypothetical protein